MGGGVPQLRYVIVVVDRGELIEASMSVRMRGRANERVRVLVLSVPGCLPRYLMRLIITFCFSDFPHVRALLSSPSSSDHGWLSAYGGNGEREAMQVCIVLKHSFGESVA